ncbi:hypothetical protein DQ04_16141010 [Trypanosoma grayi]|uniref:hypothetical protein n=1 Tax=Trypanosoma grayi TaxID=71804 RepID=UPI0004F41A6A|nr:hypothetical protein DQ04_16141010 [Trypanosoma grayi]KEG06067.1 hypothetical protein DQ04_16141010 [Trypanosoma grayi]
MTTMTVATMTMAVRLRRRIPPVPALQHLRKSGEHDSVDGHKKAGAQLAVATQLPRNLRLQFRRLVPHNGAQRRVACADVPQQAHEGLVVCQVQRV